MDLSSIFSPGKILRGLARLVFESLDFVGMNVLAVILLVAGFWAYEAFKAARYWEGGLVSFGALVLMFLYVKYSARLHAYFDKNGGKAPKG